MKNKNWIQQMDEFNVDGVQGMKTNTSRLKQYLPYLYLMLSIYIFFQATFFPQIPANFLINYLHPKLNSGAAVFFIHDYARYLTIIVYAGLALSGALFFIAINNLLLRWIKNARLCAIFHVIITQVNFILGFLCGVKVYHLLNGKNPGFFSISGESFVTLVVLLFCVFVFSIRKEKMKIL